MLWTHVLTVVLFIVLRLDKLHVTVFFIVLRLDRYSLLLVFTVHLAVKNGFIAGTHPPASVCMVSTNTKSPDLRGLAMRDEIAVPSL